MYFQFLFLNSVVPKTNPETIHPEKSTFIKSSENLETLREKSPKKEIEYIHAKDIIR